MTFNILIGMDETGEGAGNSESVWYLDLGDGQMHVNTCVGIH